MPRPQFTLRALLVATLVVGGFFGGMVLQKRLDEPVLIKRNPPEDAVFQRGWWAETIRLRDGTEWQRVVKPEDDQD